MKIEKKEIGVSTSYYTVMFLLTIILFLGYHSTVFAADTRSTETVFKWKMQTTSPMGTINAKSEEEWCETLRKISNGRLDFKLFHPGQLIPPSEIVKALGKGTIEIAFTQPTYYSGATPEAFLDVTAMPTGLLKTYNDVLHLYRYGGIDEIMRKAFARDGAYFLGSTPYESPVCSWSKRPLKRISDLKGHKMRSWGYPAKQMAKLGATPVYMAHSEVYMAMAQGVIEGSMTAGTYYRDMKYYEVCPYFYLPPQTPASASVTMVSQKAWDSLPTDLKELLTQAFYAYGAKFNHDIGRDFEQVVLDLPKYKATAIVWPEEDMQKLREAGVSLLPEIAKMNAGCAEGVKLYMDYMKERGYIK